MPRLLTATLFIRIVSTVIAAIAHQVCCYQLSVLAVKHASYIKLTLVILNNKTAVLQHQPV